MNRPEESRPRQKNMESPSDRERDMVTGRNAVGEAVKAGRSLDHILMAKGERSGSILPILAACRERGIPIKEVDSRKLDQLCGPHHQGIAAVAACREYASLDDLFAAAEKAGEPPFFVVCDGIEDPHNLGAILRSAEAAGVHGVIVPKRHNAGLTSAVYKASAGAVEYVPVARVANITQTLQELKKRGVWVYGLDMDGEAWCTADLRGAAALVVGSEGQGVSRLVKETCDHLVSLPMCGHIESLNASVACGILLYEGLRQRRNLKAR